MSHEVNVNRSDEPSSQRFPSSHHHIDQPSSVQNGLYDLLPVLICQVDVINLQQPIVHSGNAKEVNDEAFDRLLAKRKTCDRSSGALVP